MEKTKHKIEYSIILVFISIFIYIVLDKFIESEGLALSILRSTILGLVLGVNGFLIGGFDILDEFDSDILNIRKWILFIICMIVFVVLQAVIIYFLGFNISMTTAIIFYIGSFYCLWSSKCDIYYPLFLFVLLAESF